MSVGTIMIPLTLRLDQVGNSDATFEMTDQVIHETAPIPSRENVSFSFMTEDEFTLDDIDTYASWGPFCPDPEDECDSHQKYELLRFHYGVLRNRSTRIEVEMTVDMSKYVEEYNQALEGSLNEEFYEEEFPHDVIIKNKGIINKVRVHVETKKDWVT